MHPDHDAQGRLRPRGAARALAALAALTGVGILVAGCGGGGSNPGVANVSTTKTSTSQSSSPSADSGTGSALSGGGSPSASSGFTMQTGNPQEALKFSQCMRANGMPSFPDPNAQGEIQGSGINPSSPQFQKAQQKCAKYMGGGHAPSPAQQAQAEAQALKFSTCMRSHGVPDFPDPQFGSNGGGIQIKISIHRSPGSSSTLDPNSPIFQKAQKECGSLLPGRATGKAAVAAP